MTHQEMWTAYKAVSPGAGNHYGVWAYGDAPDTLAELTRTGVKTATASSGPLYALEGEPLPEVGEYIPIIQRSNVDFPLPFSPITATCSPSFMHKLISERIFLPSASKHNLSIVRAQLLS